MSKKEHYQEKIDRYLKQIDEVIAKGPYKADWASLTGMEVPDWFRRAKFGIFIPVSYTHLDVYKRQALW